MGSRKELPSEVKVATISRRIHLLIILVAILTRGTLLFGGPWQDEQRAVVADSPRYLVLARNLIDTNYFGKEYEDGIVHAALLRSRNLNETAPTRSPTGLLPEVFRTPVYPVFVAACRTITRDIRFILALQCLAGAFLSYLVIRVALAFGCPERGACLAGLLWAVHPGLLVFDCLVLTESLFNILALTAVYTAATATRPIGWAGCGLLLGITALVRPLGLLYFPFCMLLGWHRRRCTVSAAAVMAVLSVLPSAAWAWRNHAVGEGYRVSTVSNVNLLFYLAAYSVSEERGEDWLATWPTRVAEYSAEVDRRAAPGDDVFAAVNVLGAEELGKRPLMVARVMGKSTLKMAVDHSVGELFRLLGMTYQPTGLFSRFVLREAGETHSASWPVVVLILAWSGFNASIAFAAAIGLVRLFRRRQWAFAVACTLTIVLFVLATASVGLERMRLPIMLPIFLLAACSVWPPNRLQRS